MSAGAHLTAELPVYKLVIFDFDGTLVDSASWFVRTLNELVPRHNFRQVSNAEVEALRGKTNREIIAELRVPRWRLAFIAADLRRRMAADAEAIQLFDGVEAIVEQLSAAGVKLAVVSSNSESNVRRILGGRTAGQFACFDCGAGLFAKAKRFRRVIRRIGFSAAETICIGDELRDIEAAHAVGASSGAVLWGYATAASLSRGRPTLVFQDVGELAIRLAPAAA